MQKYHLLNYICPVDGIISLASVETYPNPKRFKYIIKNNNRYGEIIYIITREFRLVDNFALNYAEYLAEKYKTNLKKFLLVPKFEHKPKSDFFHNELQNNNISLTHNNAFFDIEFIKDYIASNHLSVIITDFNPISDFELKLKKFLFKIPNAPNFISFDGRNVVPTFAVSLKQEYSAATFRPKFYRTVYEFLTRYPISNKSFFNNAYAKLTDFINFKLQDYALYKSDFNKNVTSGLSKYINWGFISPQRIALEILDSDVELINKETFLEELLIRRELSENFCYYCKNYNSLDCISSWAKGTINNHKNDFRRQLYSVTRFEYAKTNDKLWNACQKQLISEGRIHGYLRMYWAKKIAEWTNSVSDALKIAVYLNDKYGFDAPSPNGYVGILWSLAGLHDRAFQDFEVTGKIRKMTYKGIKRKFNTEEYISCYESV